jgi:hypothetical protein
MIAVFVLYGRARDRVFGALDPVFLDHVLVDGRKRLVLK